MNVKMLLGGLVGGSIGVVIWVVAGLVGYEIGAIAWAIGGLAGIGTRMFNDQDSPLGALSATIIAATMIVVGKYLVYQLTFRRGQFFHPRLVAGTYSGLFWPVEPPPAWPLSVRETTNSPRTRRRH